MPSAQSKRNDGVPAIHSDRFIFRNMQKAVLKQEREKLTKLIDNFHDKSLTLLFLTYCEKFSGKHFLPTTVALWLNCWLFPQNIWKRHQSKTFSGKHFLPTTYWESSNDPRIWECHILIIRIQVACLDLTEDLSEHLLRRLNFVLFHKRWMITK